MGTRGGAVRIANEFVVMELVDILPPREPELAEVREQVKTAALNDARRTATRIRAEEVASEIRTQVGGGADFETAATEFNLNVLSPDPLQLRNLHPRMPTLPREIVRELPAHLPGDVIGPLEGRFGGLFIAYLAERTPQPVAKEDLKPQVRDMLATQFQGYYSRFQDEIIQPMIEKL